MLRLCFIYLLLSVLCVVFANYIHLIVIYINKIYSFFYFKLLAWLTPYGVKYTAIHCAMLMLLPLIIAGVPAVIYRWLTKRSMPYHLELTWCLWLVIGICHSLVYWK